MGRFPAVILLILAIWIGYTIHRDGPEKAFGGIAALLSSPQYGEADRPTRSGRVADEVQHPTSPGKSLKNWWARP
jgi:hypothetical protein